MLIAEVFGKHVEDNSPDTQKIRTLGICPFKDGKCTKSSKTDPLGICTLSNGETAASICPSRFLESDLIFKAAAEIVFGKAICFAVFPEIKLLRVDSETTGKSKKIGKVDFLLGKLENGKVTDFAALEVQASYFSGTSIRPAFNDFLETGKLDESIADRRPDFRSSAQKRLVPQLQLKVPVFRRWGKKFFVVVDTQFFAALPKFKTTTVGNSEVIWLAFPITNLGRAYELQAPRVFGSHWDDVSTALREGEAPEPEDILVELSRKLKAAKKLET